MSNKIVAGDTVFVSYARGGEGGKIARWMQEEFPKRGIRPLIDYSDIPKGHAITPAVIGLIEECDHVLVIATRAAVNSVWVRREIDVANQLRRSLHALSVHVTPQEVSQLPMFKDERNIYRSLSELRADLPPAAVEIADASRGFAISAGLPVSWKRSGHLSNTVIADYESDDRIWLLGALGGVPEGVHSGLSGNDMVCVQRAELQPEGVSAQLYESLAGDPEYRGNPFDQVESGKELDSWAHVLEEQVKLFASNEIALLKSLGIDKATKIADIGAGTGSYTAELQAQFRDTEVHAFDSNKGMLRRCEERMSEAWKTTSRAHHWDVGSDRPVGPIRDCEFGVLRMVLQHSPDPRMMLEKVGDAMGGEDSKTIVVIEEDNAHIQLRPYSVEFERMLWLWDEFGQATRCDRNISTRFKNLIPGNLELKEHRALSHISIDPEWHRTAMEFYASTVRAIQETHAFLTDDDAGRLIEKLRDLGQHPEYQLTYTQSVFVLAVR
jgi:SAM-dependent methyltransferase